MICTTIKQSRELLSLGLNPETADMLILNCVAPNGKVDDTNFTIISKDQLNPLAEIPEILPAWSLNALIELIPEYSVHRFHNETKIEFWSDVRTSSPVYSTESYENTIDAAVEMVSWLINSGYIKKGEEK